MKLIEKFTCVLLSTVVAAGPALAQQEASYWFRYKGSPVFVGGPQTPQLPPVDENDNEDETGDPTETDLRFTNSLPEEVYADEVIDLALKADGGSGTYTFSAENLPSFMQISPDGRVTMNPTADDIGPHTGIILRVSDGENTVSRTISVLVRVPMVSEEVPMASAAYLNGVEISRHLTYNTKTDDYITLPNAGSTLEYVFPTPIESFGAFIHTNSRVDVEVYVDGNWVTITNASGIKDAFNSDYTRYTSDRWRLRKSTYGSARVYAFRPGFAEPHDLPKLPKSNGYLGMKGLSTKIEATAFPSSYVDGNVTIAFAPGTTVPSGVSVQPDGTLTVDEDADISTEFRFTLTATDSVGFQTSKEFYVTAEAMLASEIMAHDFKHGSDPVDYRQFYDGDNGYTSIKITQAKPLIVDFGAPVQASKAVVYFSSSFGEVVVEYESDGEWVPITTMRSQSSPGSFGRTVVAQRWRIRPSTNSSYPVGDFRIGAGPAHSWPTLVTAGLPGLPEITSATRIEGGDSSTYRNLTQDSAYEIVSGSLPPSVVLLSDGTFDVTSEEPEEGMWSFTVRMTDAEGFTADREYHIAHSTVLASDIFATVTNKHNAAADRLALYDGDASTYFTLGDAWPYTIDLGRPAYFDNVFLKKTTGGLVFEALINGQWIEVGQAPSKNFDGVLALNGGYVAQKVRIQRSAGGYSTTQLQEVRLGAGPAHNPPQITHDGQSIFLEESAKTVELVSTVDRGHYFPENTLTWTLASGNLPDGATLSPAGVLSLPSVADVAGNFWNAVIRVTDSAGYSATAEYNFRKAEEADLASETYPVSINRGELHWILDGLTTDTGKSISFSKDNNAVIIDYGKKVKFDTLTYSLYDYAAFLDIESAPGEWVEVATLERTKTSHAFGEWLTTQKVRIRTASSTARLREFRLGSGPVYVDPVIGKANRVATLSNSTQNISLTANWDTHYNDEQPTFEIVNGALPDGASITPEGVLIIPPRSQINGDLGSWEFTVRITDQRGFSYDSKMSVIDANAGVSASTVLPISAKLGGTPVDVMKLYDGLNDSGYLISKTVSGSTELEVEFADPISLSAIRTDGSNNNLEIELQSPEGNWIALEKTWNSAYGRYTFASTWVAKKFRFRLTSNGSFTLTEARFGDGNAYTAPALQNARQTFQVGTSTKTQTLSATRSAYTSANDLIWSIVESSDPARISISQTGTLSILSANEVRTDYVTVRVADVHGGHSDATYYIAHRATTVPSAATIAPISITNGSTPVDVSVLYDESTSTRIDVPMNQNVVFEFADFVRTDAIRVQNERSGSPTTARIWAIEMEIDGKWFPTMNSDFSRSLTSTGNSTVGDTLFAKKFRIRPTNGAAYLGTFKWGVSSSFPTVN